MNTQSNKHRELEARAIQDYKEHRGAILAVTALYGMMDDESVEFYPENPVLVRVVGSPMGDVLNWNYGNPDWLDPVWTVEPVNGYKGFARTQWLYVYGNSFCTDGKEDNQPLWILQKKPSLISTLGTAVKSLLNPALATGRMDHSNEDLQVLRSE